MPRISVQTSNIQPGDRFHVTVTEAISGFRVTQEWHWLCRTSDTFLFWWWRPNWDLAGKVFGRWRELHPLLSSVVTSEWMGRGVMIFNPRTAPLLVGWALCQRKSPQISRAKIKLAWNTIWDSCFDGFLLVKMETRGQRFVGHYKVCKLLITFVRPVQPAVVGIPVGPLTRKRGQELYVA